MREDLRREKELARSVVLAAQPAIAAAAEAAQKAIAAVVADSSAAAAKLSRLEKQEQLLEQRAREMFARELASIEELEKLEEEQERGKAATEQSPLQPQSSGSPKPLPSFSDFDWAQFNALDPLGLGAVGETSRPTPSSSSGS
jgi:hypothetical protein